MFEPVRYTKFAGLDKSNDPISHVVGEGAIKLKYAENVDILRTAAVERRRGYTAWSNASDYTSLWGNGVVCYAVKTGNLIEIALSKTFRVLLASVGTAKMKFIDTHDEFIHFTNGTVSGKIKDGIVYAHTPSSDPFKEVLPAGDFLAYLAPRLLVVKGNALYIGGVTNKDVYHRVSGFLQFDTDIRMVAPVDSNMFVSDSKYTWFCEKTQNQLVPTAPFFKVKKVAQYPSAPGNPVKSVESIKTALAYYAQGTMWVSERGICIGGSDGAFENLTFKVYDMPAYIQSATVEYVQNGDLNQLISVIKGV